MAFHLRSRMGPVAGMALAAWLAGASSAGAAAPLFENLGFTNNPSVDATVFRNVGTLNYNSSDTTAFSVSAPFQTLNTLHYTNTLSGLMLGSPGFRFEFLTNNFRNPAQNFVNLGTIIADVETNIQITSGFTFVPGGSIEIQATNVVNGGSLLSGGGGLIRIEGKNVNLTRSVLAALSTNYNFVSGGLGSVSNYYNGLHVRDVYWGTGTSQVFSAGQQIIPLALPFIPFFPPFARAPSHEVTWPVFGGSTFAQVPYFGTGSFSSFVFVTQATPTNRTIQVVLLATNTTATNLSANVRFVPTGTRGAEVLVEFRLPDFNLINGETFTNLLYFLDQSFTIGASNRILSANIDANTFRPSVYQVSRDSLISTLFSFSSPSNENIANIVYFQPGFSNSIISNNFYAGYAAEIASSTASILPQLANNNLALTDPAFLPGRVEILSGQLDLSLSRIRADSTAIIRTTNLIASTGAIVDAPNVAFSVANTTTFLSLTNFLPATVARLNGPLFAYSAVWTNTFGPLELAYHVLILDASSLRDRVPVNLSEVSVRGTNVLIENAINAGRSLVVDSPRLTFGFSNQLVLSSATIPNIVSTNFPNLNYFTNLGRIFIPGDGHFGSDRPAPLSNFVNRGTIAANTLAVRAAEYENSGTNTTGTFFGTNYLGGGGTISITADSAKLEGGITSGRFLVGGNLDLRANSLKIRNHTILSAGTLTLVVTNSITDSGATGSNVLTCLLGFHLPIKPGSGDLLGTTLATTAPVNRDIPHTWAATDYGAVREGFTDNVSIGRLVLSTGTNIFANNRLSFAGVGARNALYADFLELSGNISNNLASFLNIETNLTIYFANANVPVETLDGQLGGRLRWVKDFAGPNSSSDFLLPDGQTIKVNIAKLNSQLLDSDADGIANAFDLIPFNGVVLRRNVVLTNAPPGATVISWNGAARTFYRIDSSTNLNVPVPADRWQFLANFTNSVTTNGLVTFTDTNTLPSNVQRYYRVTYQP